MCCYTSIQTQHSNSYFSPAVLVVTHRLFLGLQISNWNGHDCFVGPGYNKHHFIMMANNNKCFFSFKTELWAYFPIPTYYNIYNDNIKHTSIEFWQQNNHKEKSRVWKGVQSGVNFLWQDSWNFLYAFLKIEYFLLWNGTTVNWPFLYLCLSNVHTLINEACYAMTVRHFKWSVGICSRQESTNTFFLRLTFIFLQN